MLSTKAYPNHFTRIPTSTTILAAFEDNYLYFQVAKPQAIISTTIGSEPLSSSISLRKCATTPSQYTPAAIPTSTVPLFAGMVHSARFLKSCHISGARSTASFAEGRRGGGSCRLEQGGFLHPVEK